LNFGAFWKSLGNTLHTLKFQNHGANLITMYSRLQIYGSSNYYDFRFSYHVFLILFFTGLHCCLEVLKKIMSSCVHHDEVVSFFVVIQDDHPQWPKETWDFVKEFVEIWRCFFFLYIKATDSNFGTKILEWNMRFGERVCWDFEGILGT
jgi:hypothetical protein